MAKVYKLEDGIIAFPYEGDGDVRGYRPPEFFEATADLIGIHPATGEELESSEWWIFLTPYVDEWDEEEEEEEEED